MLLGYGLFMIFAMLVLIYAELVGIRKLLDRELELKRAVPQGKVGA